MARSRKHDDQLRGQIKKSQLKGYRENKDPKKK